MAQVVFDEVHHVLKDHPYRKLAQQLCKCDGPVVLGLTASLTYAVGESCLFEQRRLFVIAHNIYVYTHIIIYIYIYICTCIMVCSRLPPVNSAFETNKPSSISEQAVT